MASPLPAPIAIGDARRFSLDAVQRAELARHEDALVRLLCFEAGQTDDEAVHAGTATYQVLEGEALVRSGEQRLRLGKGRLLAVPAGTRHRLENAGGGLLVVLETRALGGVPETRPSGGVSETRPSGGDA